MTLEEYIQHKVDSIVADLTLQAPADTCPRCTLTTAHLAHENDQFVYHCEVCGDTWEADTLEIDEHGHFQLLEWAD